MTNKKSRFWTFIFSLIPGAGEMYMGFFRHGISVMALFFLTITVSAFINIGPLLFLLPIIWFYSFFHVHNLKNMPDEEFYALEDDFILPLKGTSYDNINVDVLIKKYRKPLAIILIIIGLTILWRNLISLLDYIMPNFLTNFLWEFSYQIPQAIIGILILLLGLYLITGKKRELDDKQGNKAPYSRDFGYHKDSRMFQEPSVFSHPEAPQEPIYGENPHTPEGAPTDHNLHTSENFHTSVGEASSEGTNEEENE